MTKTFRGIVRGRTIELEEDLGMAEGQEIEIQVKIVEPIKKWGEGVLRSAGGWAAYPEMDAIMQKVHENRKMERGTQSAGE